MLDKVEKIEFSPIGYISSNQKYPYDAPRQGVFATADESVITLNEQCNYEQALRELAGFERVWLLFYFHHNRNWKPLVSPPRGTDKKIGLFATRSPYRPNPIGMSAVKLLRIEGLKLYITESDLLDETPVLDIKPYIPYCDAFPGIAAGWTEAGTQEHYAVSFEQVASEGCDWLEEHSAIPLRSFIVRELEYRPTDSTRKRVKPISRVGEALTLYELAYRTWRIAFQLDAACKHVIIKRIYSGYSTTELASEEDRYKDKLLHRAYNDLWPSCPDR